MDYKKKYKDALSRARQFSEHPLQEDSSNIVEYIFPELKESEDEKVRQELFDFCKNKAEKYPNDPKYKNISAWIAWLEKQEGCEYIKKDWLKHIKQSWYKEGFIDGKYSGEKQGEKKPIEEINGEDYGIDSLYHAQRILEKTLGEVEGYQSDDGILDHKAAITAVKKLYKQKPFDYENANIQQKDFAPKIESFDKYEGLTDFERTLADICVGWIGQELGWKQYIKDNADVLLKIAIKMFNSVQDAPFEQKPTDNDMIEALRTEYEKGRADAIAEMQKEWIEEDENILRTIISDGIRGAGFDMLQIEWLKSLKQRIGG